MEKRNEKRKFVVYVAGPYRDQRGEYFVRKNVLAADRAAQWLWCIGAVALCPHKNTQSFGGLVEDKVFIEGDLELLRRCDAVLAIEGWNASEGASMEVAYATANGIPVFLHGALRDHARLYKLIAQREKETELLERIG